MRSLRGFAILSAIFILVVLAALGAFILSISSSQQIGSALDVQGVRAYQAARAGIEWGVYQVQSYDPSAAAGDGYRFGYDCQVTDTGSQCFNRRSCANASGSFDVFGFSVTVTCSATDDPGGFSGPTVYQLISTACLPAGGTCPNAAPGPFYTERRLTVTF